MVKLSTELAAKLQKEDFKYVYNILRNFQIPSQSELLNLIITSSEVYRASTSRNTISPEDLLNLLKCLTGQLATLNEQQFEKYLQVVFCLLKELSKQNCYGAVIQFKPFIFPAFFKSEFTSRINQFYYNIMTSFYNDLGKIFNTRCKEHANKMFPLAEIIVEIAEKTQTEVLHAEYVSRCVLALLGMELPPQQIEAFYLKNLKTLKKSNDQEVTLKLLTTITNFYKTRKYTEAETCFEATYYAILTKNFPELASILSVRNWFRNHTEDAAELKNIFILLREYLKANGWTGTSQVLFKLIRYFALSSEGTLLNKTPSQQVSFFKFLWYLSSDIKTFKCKCSCKSAACSSPTEMLDSCEFLSVILRIGTKFIGKTPQAQRIYKLELLKYIDNYCEACNDLKSHKCGHFTKAYTECVYFVYQLGVLLHKNSDPEISIHFMKKYVTAVLLHEGVSEDVQKNQFFSGALKAIAENFCELKQYENSLAASALACSLLKLDATSHHFVLWVKTKAACRDNASLQQTTLVSIFETSKNEIDSYFTRTKYELTRENKISLLVLELEGYKKRWKSKAPMMAAFKQLVSLENGVACAKTAVRIWEFGNIPAQDSFCSILKDLVKKIPENSPSSSLLRAHLLFLVHKFQLVDAIVENCSHIDKTIFNMTKVQEERVHELVPGDADDEVEIVSAYSSLKLNKYIKMMKHLDSCYELVESTLKNRFEGDEIYDLESLYRLLIQIGHEYFLHNHKIKSVVALTLALEYAVKLGREEYVLQSSGYVLEQTNAGKNERVDKIVKRAEKSQAYLEEKGFFKELCMYFLCKAECFLYSNPDLAFESYFKALEYKEKFTNEVMHLARIDYVKHRLLLLPCSFNSEEHKTRTNSVIHSAQGHAFRHYNHSQTEITTESSYNMSVFFKIQEEMTKMYSDLHLPRPTLMYSREVLVIAQKMILPFRVSKLLYYLSQADIFFGNFTNCEEKLSGLTTILGIVQRRTPSPSPKQAKKRSKDPEEEALEGLASSMREMVLEMPKNSGFLQVRPSSPSFCVENFRLPSFLNHKVTCQCFPCNWLEYQLAILHKTLIQGIVHVYGKNLFMAQKFLCGGLQIFKSLQQRSTKILEVQKLDKLVSTKLFDETHCLLLKEWGDVVLRCGEQGLECGEEINTILLNIFKESEHLDLIHVYNKVVLQKINIYKLKKDAQAKKVLKSRFLFESSASGTSTASTTPESKQSKVTVNVIRSPPGSLSPLPPPKTRFTKPKFNIFDDQEEEAKEVQQQQPKKPINKNLLLNPSVSDSTPVSKVKIYTEKGSTRKKKVLSELATPKVKQEKDFLMPATPLGQNLAEKKPEKNNLTDRSKILTEKLKSSMKKPPAESSAGPSRTRSVRTNLLSDLEQAESENAQKLRRSRRNI